MASSVPLRTHFLTQGEYVAAFGRSALLHNAAQYGLRILPVELPVRSSYMAIITLKDRTLTPVAERFIMHFRQFTQTTRTDRRPRK